MRFTTTLAKNLKLLFRSKESAYTIIIGPLLIVLLVGFAFMGSTDEYTVQVGAFAPNNTDFAQRTVSTLNEKEYLVSVFPTAQDCVESVKEGENHACIVFSDIETGNETVPVTFYIDMSRMNIAYQIADDLSSALDIQADQIRKALATDTLLRAQSAAIMVERDYNITVKVSDRIESAFDNLRAARDALPAIPNGTRNTSDIRLVKGYQLGLANNVRFVSNQSYNAIETALNAMQTLEAACDSCSPELIDKMDETRRELEDTQDELLRMTEITLKDTLLKANLQLQYAIEDAEAIRGAIDNASAAGNTIRTNVRSAVSSMELANREMGVVSMSMNYTAHFLRADTTSVDTITSPVTTSIVSVTVTDDRLSFAYPYLLIIVIMFIGMLLASSLVVADKTSRARFRNFTTPVSDGYHVLVGFITAFLIILLETIIILIASSFFVAQPLFLNPSGTSLLIIISIVVFTFLGMIIGYLSKTQEAGMIASISVGSVLIFVSNLIMPIEGMTSIVQWLTAFNPYVVLSELLKRSMLYGVTLNQALSELSAIIALSIVLLLFTLYIQRRARKRYFRQEAGILEERIPVPLILGQYVIHDEVELLDSLDKMTRTEFEEHVKADDNRISVWTRIELRNKSLSKKLRTTSKEKMMLRLDDHLKRHGKHLKH